MSDELPSDFNASQGGQALQKENCEEAILRTVPVTSSSSSASSLLFTEPTLRRRTRATAAINDDILQALTSPSKHRFTHRNNTNERIIILPYY